MMLFSASIYGQEEEDINPVLEAGKATVGRVFGVAGAGGDIDYYVVEMHQRTPRNSGVRSALVPGWGQAFNNEKVKGVVLGLTFFASAYGAVTYYRKSQDTHEDYKARGVASDDLYDDYESELTAASVLGGLAFVLWGYSVIDASRGAYRQLYSQERSVNIVFSDGEPRLKVIQRF